MIIALIALAFAMIVGGLLAAFFGWDIVLIERGWTMVIAGSISAASGAVLLGVTAVVSRLSQIQSELARLQLSLDEDAAVEAPVGPTGMSMAALSGGLLGGTMFGRGDAKEPSEEQRDLPLFDEEKKLEPAIVSAGAHEEPAPSRMSEPFMPFPPRMAPDLSTSGEEEAPEVKVPDFLLGDRSRETYEEIRTTDIDESLYVEEAEVSVEEKRVEEEREDILDVVTEPAPVTEPERGPEPESAEEAVTPEEHAPAEEEGALAEPRPATIIGTYNSGDNTYVMFSDGSIEAQTPSGIFHFQSLDELKAFIAAGGEGGGSASI